MSKEQWTFRQSDFGTFNACPEHLRRNIYEPRPQPVNSDQTRGNVCHAVFEEIGQRVLDGHTPLMDDVNAVAGWHVDRLFPTVDEWKSPKERIEASVYANVEGWFFDILPKLSLTAVERQFRVKFDETDEYEVWLTGTPDVEDAKLGVVDYKCPGEFRMKSNGKPGREDWHHERWDMQSHVYTWVAAYDDDDFDSEREFHRVEIVEGDHHWLTIRRGPEHWAALRDYVHGVVELQRANLTVWPQNWASYKCSPKWCEHWSVCRGKHLGANPW